MKPLRELRDTLPFQPKEQASRISYLMKQNIDFDVELKSKGVNLQRYFVWTDLQKSEIIMSILLDRHIPHLSIITCADETLQIIDGKQRLGAILDFINGKFFLLLEDGSLAVDFNGLPDEYKRAIKSYHIRYYNVNDGLDYDLTDDDKIKWFKLLNFAGTQQEQSHLKKLNSLL